MNSPLENLSKQQLIDLLKKKEKAIRTSEKAADRRLRKVEEKMGQAEQKFLRYERKIDYLQGQIAQLQRMLFGQKRERFEGDPSQGVLPFEASEQQTRHEETITYLRTKQPRGNHNGREPLPDHLPVEEIEIYPQGDLSEMVCIGREVTEELELEPARFYIKRYIRYKYAPKTKDSGGGVLIGSLPERVIDKGIAGPGLLASILVDKYVDHLPLYRQRQRFLRENIPIAASTLDGWAAAAMDRLGILWEHLLTDTKVRGYLQADETPIKVLETRKKGSTHQGWYWVYHDPIARTVLFDYQPTRRGSAAKEVLDDFKGYLQTDGYSGYKKIGARPGVTHLGCWAHARRAAMAYSFFATCKAHQVNPHQWLKHVLENIMSTKYNNVRDLYPQNFKTNM